MCKSGNLTKRSKLSTFPLEILTGISLVPFISVRLRKEGFVIAEVRNNVWTSDR
jgi:hypothetical protein